MRTGIQFGLKIIGKYAILLILSLLFVALIPSEQYWLQVILNVLFVGGLAFLTWSEAGYLGERAETLRATIETRREKGEPVDSEQEKAAFRPQIAIIGFFVGALPLLLIALVNLATLPAYPQSLDPSYFEVAETIEAQIDLPETTDGSAVPAESAPATTIAPETEMQTAAPETDASQEEELPPNNPFNTVARLAFMPFISLYSLLIDHLMVLYILMVPLSFLIPAFGLWGYLRGPKLRKQKLEAIKKGIRAKKRKEKRERRASGPKPEV